jgi:hypothetical protein
MLQPFLFSGEALPFVKYDEVYNKILSQNKLPDNFSLIYDIEEFNGNKWESSEKTKVIWDFKGKRAYSFSLERGQSEKIMHVTKKIMTPRVGINVGETVERNSKNFEISDTVFPFKIIDDPSSSSAAIHHPDFIGGGGFDSYVNLFYPGVSRSPFIETLSKGKHERTFKFIANQISTSAISPDGGQEVEYVFAADGTFARKVLSFKIQKDQKSKPEMIPCVIWNVKKMKNIAGFQFPMILEGEINTSNGLFILKNIKRRLIVRENTIKVNQSLNDIDFGITIPVGASVMDERKGIIYEADGMSGEWEESLVKALEDLAKKAKGGK